MHPLRDLAVPRDKVAIHWFEQSAYAVKDSAGTVVLIDPYFPHVRPPDRFVHPKPPLNEPELPVDFILVTHNHLDHTSPETLVRIYAASPRVHCVGPEESIATILQTTPIAAAQTTVIRAGESVRIGSMEVAAVYAKPPEGDPERAIKPPDVTHLGFVLRASRIGLYFTGDLLNTFAERDDLVQAVARLKPDIGFLTNHPTEGEFPFFDGCARMARRIGLAAAVPAHYECFVKRNYDPREWAGHFPAGGPRPILIPHNSHVFYPD